MEFILDTNICIYIIKKRPAVVLDRFSKIPVGSLAISSITVAELAFGVQKSLHVQNNQAALDYFLTAFTILDFGKSAAAEYGHIRARLETSGTTYRSNGSTHCRARKKPWLDASNKQ